MHERDQKVASGALSAVHSESGAPTVWKCLLTGMSCLAAFACLSPQAFAALIDFDGVGDGTAVGTSYSDVAFSNATVVTAGLSLNEFEFPPRSGDSVAFDDGGPLEVVFASDIDFFAGYFTYTTTPTLTAFDSNGAVLGQATGVFVSNMALSGDPGSSPNELLQVAMGGIRRVVIAGAPAGTSFSVDDISYRASPIPEPSSLALVSLSLVVLAGALTRARQGGPRECSADPSSDYRV